MATENILVGKDELEIPLAPVTVIFNSANKNTHYPERLMLTPAMTLAHFDTMTEIDPYTAAFFKLIVNDYAEPITVENIQTAPDAFKHLVGLFSLSLRYLLAKKKFGWKYPEFELHPRYQGNLADALILFSMPEQFAKFIRGVVVE
jgi:hypothetical protein